MSSTTVNGMTYVSSSDAASIDDDLMGELNYTLEQLMELAGLSVAQSFYDAYCTNHQHTMSTYNILVIVGPGNNGGDALVAARHMYMFGLHNITILYPTINKSCKKNQHYSKLTEQCKSLGISVYEQLIDIQPHSCSGSSNTISSYTHIIDGIFGFSYNSSGGIRSPFDAVIQYMIQQHDDSHTQIISIDCVSGYDVNGGDVNNIGLSADMLVSLTTPKLFAVNYTGIHYIGGRFIWNEFAQKHKLSVPQYNGCQQFVNITHKNSNM